MTSVCYDGPNNFIDLIEKDGYFIIKNFFKRDAVEAVRSELKAVLDKDEARRKKIQGPPVDASVPYRSIYTKLMHTIWFPSLQSPRYHDLVNDMFDSVYIQDLMKGLCGDNFRLRIDLIRRSSGENDHVADFQLPHVWHRDTPGEFTYGIFFDDMPEHGGGGTAVIPGTHWDARDPRWDLMIGEKKNMTRKHYLGNRPLLFVPEDLSAKAKMNKRVSQKANASKVEISGQMGDLYLFLNDTWHGRAPNISGKRWMISRVGGFATDFPFKDDIPLPEDAHRLHGALETYYDRNPAPNTQTDTLFRRMNFKRKSNTLTRLAAMEKDKLLKEFYTRPEVAEAREALLQKHGV
ncbi:phytanoyl-CoA dioxygenase family protein [Hellea sp.]|nr:phytanoyl-CoA dioxygenase family protein [Hellea sp.]